MSFQPFSYISLAHVDDLSRGLPNNVDSPGSNIGKIN